MNLALTLQHAKTPEEAESLLRRALLIYENALGSEHRVVGSTCFHLAALLHKKGLFSDAEPFYRRALAIAEKSFGSEHTETANTMGMLAKLLHATGEVAGARLLMGRAYNIAAKTLGEKHPTTLDYEGHPEWIDDEVRVNAGKLRIARRTNQVVATSKTLWLATGTLHKHRS